MTNKDLIKLNEKHEKLVTKLKNSLIVGQAGFLSAGRYLCEIRENETYKSEDADNPMTFTEFISKPDLPLPGRTPASRVRIAQTLMRIYNFYVIERQLSQEELAKIGWTKLDMLVPVVESKPKETESWFDKAKDLTTGELYMEIKTKDKSLSEIYECKHKNITKVVSYKCSDCNNSFKHDPRRKGK